MLKAIDNVKKGSIWTNVDKEFKVLKVIQIKGKTWIFYKQIKNKTEEVGQEFSCYKEAFLAKFVEYKNY